MICHPLPLGTKIRIFGSEELFEVTDVHEMLGTAQYEFTGDNEHSVFMSAASLGDNYTIVIHQYQDVVGPGDEMVGLEIDEL